MHVEYQVGARLGLDQAAKQQPGQEALARAAAAEDAVRAFDKALQVETDRHIHVAGPADGEVLAALLAAEDGLEIAGAGRVDAGEMAGDGTRRLQAFGGGCPGSLGQLQGGAHGRLGVSGAAAQRLAHQIAGALRRVLAQDRIGGPQPEAADRAEEAHVPAVDHHELPLAEQLDRLPALQVDGDALLRIGGGDGAEQPLRLGGRMAVGAVHQCNPRFGRLRGRQPRGCVAAVAYAMGAGGVKIGGR